MIPELIELMVRFCFHRYCNVSVDILYIKLKMFEEKRAKFMTGMCVCVFYRIEKKINLPQL